MLLRDARVPELGNLARRFSLVIAVEQETGSENFA